MPLRLVPILFHYGLLHRDVLLYIAYMYNCCHDYHHHYINYTFVHSDLWLHGVLHVLLHHGVLHWYYSVHLHDTLHGSNHLGLQRIQHVYPILHMS